MKLVDVLTLPLRAGIAAAQISLGVAELTITTARIVATNSGAATAGAAALANPRGPVQMIQQLTALTAQDRPIGQALAAGGPLDRVLAEDGALERLLAPGGLLDRLTAEDGPLERLTAQDGAVERLTAKNGVIDRALAEDGILETLLAENGAFERLVAEGGPLDQIVLLSDTLTALAPNLERMSVSIDILQDTVAVLSAAVGPLGELAGKLPNRWLKGKAIGPGSDVAHSE